MRLRSAVPCQGGGSYSDNQAGLVESYARLRPGHVLRSSRDTNSGESLAVPMTSVRQLGISDILGLRGMRRAYISLAAPEALFHRRVDDLLAAIPVGRRYSRVFVSDSSRSVRAVVELRPEREDYRWIVTGMGACLERGSDPTDEVCKVWSELLAYAANVAGHSGAKRVHTAVPVDTLAQQTLIRAGFSIYGHRSVMAANEVHLALCDEALVRERDPSDAWSIHHLYHRTTPRPVQYAEALTSNHWDARRTPYARTRGFVIDGEHGLAGYCQVMSRGKFHILDVILLPESMDRLASLVSESIVHAGIETDSEIWVTVPDYHREYTVPLESIGFRETERQSMMVRYTMVPANGRHASWTSVVSDVIERIPARTPVVSRWERDGA